MSKDLISTNIAGYSVLSEPEAREQLELFRKLISEVSREERELYLRGIFRAFEND